MAFSSGARYQSAPGETDDKKFLTGLNKTLRHRDILLWMPPNYSRENFYAVIGNLRRSGLLRRVKIKEKFAIQLTPKGLDALINRYGHTGLAGSGSTHSTKPQGGEPVESTSLATKWDGRWRLVLGRLGGKLAGRFGLGCLRRGAYISAFPFSDALIQTLGDGGRADKVRLFSEAVEKFPDPRGLAKNAWGLDELNSRYAALIRRFQMGFGQQIKEKKLAALRKVRSDFIEIASEDPWLPMELLPAGWAFFEARGELNKYMSII